MISTLIVKPSLLLFTSVAAFGVLVHDMQVDRAATVAMALPAAIASYAAIDTVLKSSEHHVHVERTSAPKHINALRMTLPRIQPRDDERRYTQGKKLVYTTGDTNYIWPSV